MKGRELSFAWLPSYALWVGTDCNSSRWPQVASLKPQVSLQALKTYTVVPSLQL